MTPIPDHDVRAELDRILATKSFSSAGRLSKLLSYVVGKTLAGETDQLKEYAVGVEVFERDAYYNGDGASSPLRITLPRGGYSARFERVEAMAAVDAPVEAEAPIEAPVRTSRKLWLPALALLVVISTMVLWLVDRDRQPLQDLRPTAAVLPFEANMIGGDNSNYSALITEAVTSELARLGTLSVASYTSAMQFEGQRRPMSEIAAALNSAYVVEASVDDEANEILVVARIVNAETDRKMWVSDYRGARDDVRGIAQRIAFDVSDEIVKRTSAR